MRAQDILPDHLDEVRHNGTTIRKGSVGAFLANAVALEAPGTHDDDRAALLRDIEELLPALRALGLFDVFDIRNPQLRAFVDARP
ncbi:MAG: hypothetical protein V4636_01220 [Pseudomonadota bacterium]